MKPVYLFGNFKWWSY